MGDYFNELSANFYLKYVFLGNLQFSFWIFTLLAKHEFFDVSIENILKLFTVMRSIDNETFVFLVNLGLGS